MDYNKSYIKDLETIQCALIKTTLRVLPGTATAGIYALTGITGIAHEIWKRKLSYYNHVQNMPENRWAKKAFREQFEWGVTGELWNDTGKCTLGAKLTSAYWLSGVQLQAKDMKMDLPNGWRNQDVKIFINGTWNKHVAYEVKKHQTEEHNTLRFLGPLQQDHQYNSITQSWWMKMRLGSIRLKTRPNANHICPICNIANDTTDHMMACTRYPAETVQERLNEPLPQDRWLNWIFHPDRTAIQRSRVSQWIHNRWKHRTRVQQGNQGNG